MEVYPSRQPLLGLFNAKGALRKRAPRQTKAQRGPTGKYIPDIEEARRLTEASRTEIIYIRQNELKDSKTEGVQRLKKERRELEERAILTNEKAAAAALAGQAVNSAVRDHVKHITSEFENALKDLDEAHAEPVYISCKALTVH